MRIGLAGPHDDDVGDDEEEMRTAVAPADAAAVVCIWDAGI